MAPGMERVDVANECKPKTKLQYQMNDFTIRTLLERNREVKNVIAIRSNCKYVEKSLSSKNDICLALHLRSDRRRYPSVYPILLIYNLIYWVSVTDCNYWQDFCKFTTRNQVERPERFNL